MAYEIELKDLPGRGVATIRVQTTPDGIRGAFEDTLPEIYQQFNEAAVNPPMAPFAIYYEYTEDTVDMEVGLPMPEPIATHGRVQGRELDPTEAAVTFHEGPYTSIGDAHRAVEEWIEREGRERNGPPFEVYWAGPNEESDPSKWRTEVGYPIK